MKLKYLYKQNSQHKHMLIIFWGLFFGKYLCVDLFMYIREKWIFLDLFRK